MSIVEHPYQEREQFVAIWAQLHENCLDNSFFTSPEWCSAWLKTFGMQLQPELYSLRLLGTERALDPSAPHREVAWNSSPGSLCEHSGRR